MHGVPEHLVANRPADEYRAFMQDSGSYSLIPFCYKCIYRMPLGVQTLKKALRATTTEKKPLS